jgi:hypothetical protein
MIPLLALLHLPSDLALNTGGELPFNVLRRHDKIGTIHPQLDGPNEKNRVEEHNDKGMNVLRLVPRCKRGPPRPRAR